ncbi:GMC family oxidoreductase [Acidocella aminolytica]|uniref:Alcohol/sorbose/choline dehydrogenase n=1 Tax=Acidocella aminolytica 101 = DSM 11237 TaxID=1120923 RepID=A0A0D6PGN1_9PROT|nr:GMC family oxidoreductase N-terminal domain-containing protein [Acidocella aminolytica]GAN80358.1 alcohol/sorbose/choline dehydrogenase [Acidocella aminolytica 101 = DSM 11237]GBQ42920.1 choline dehydrogenase [Acidocella aminolytica 101 = DSM 11237]SHE29406.1 Choline dehydrogenase [Acidocella aminolytica 101 = DSM 11237]
MSQSEKSTYDVIVVGGGAAGCVVAGRIATETQASVLLLEAGSNDSDPLIHLPAGYAKILEHDLHVWPYNTVPQIQLDGTVRRYRSGKVIGGGSSINAMAYVRGQARDYDAWQDAVGDTGAWSFSDLLPHFIAQECSDTFHNKYHGVDGYLKVSLPRDINELNQGCLKAFQEYGLPYNPDYNGESQSGVSPVQSTVWKSRRCSSADAHLRPALASGRLEVRVKCVVERVVIENGITTGVQYSASGKNIFVHAKQVILSAGALHTPKILMHSGIGPAEHLKKHGIQVIHDAPDVGLNLQDHPIVPLKAYCKEKLGYQNTAQGFGAVKAGLRYALTKDGPASGSGIETVSYWNPENLSALPTIQCYHVPIVSEDGLRPTGTQPGITFELVVLQPRSRGSIRLSDGDPTSMPLIDPNFMGDSYDLSTAIKSIRAMREVVQKPSLKSLLKEEIAPGPALQSDDDLAAWIKKVVTTMWHPVGTCRMGSDDRAVVDAHLRVNGVSGLRVIDASIMPNIVSGNTNAPTMALARHGADMFIKCVA